jgi:hypothetical protein
MNGPWPATVLASARIAQHFSLRAFLPLAYFDQTAADQALSHPNNLYDEARPFRVTLAFASYGEGCLGKQQFARHSVPGPNRHNRLRIRVLAALHVSGPFCRTCPVPQPHFPKANLLLEPLFLSFLARLSLAKPPRYFGLHLLKSIPASAPCTPKSAASPISTCAKSAFHAPARRGARPSGSVAALNAFPRTDSCGSQASQGRC